jgi:hypothetical protein
MIGKVSAWSVRSRATSSRPLPSGRFTSAMSRSGAWRLSASYAAANDSNAATS